VGDVFVIDADGSGEYGPEESPITAINSDTELEVATAFTGTYGAGTDYEIRRAFGAENPYLVNWTVFGNQVVIADYTRGPYKWDGTTFTEFDSGISYIPACVAFWQDRLWMGRTREAGSYYHQRYRWSNPASGGWTTFDAGDYQDLPYTRGGLQRLYPLSEVMIAYFSDGIYRMYPSERNDIPALVDRIETGGVGLVGQQAVCSSFDSHFFVGQDNIYMLDSRGRRAIGTKVVKQTIRECENLWAVYATPMVKLDSIAFAFPTTGTGFSKIWTFNYKSGAWGYHDLSGSSTFSVAIPNEITWDDTHTGGGAFDGSWNSNPYGTWDSLGSEFPVREDFYIFSGDYLYWLRNQAQDTGGVVAPITLETPDYDFEKPDLKKTAYRFGMKLETPVTADVTFTVQGSTDRGNTWKALGTLTIENGKDEGFCSFRLTGSLIRLKITGSANIDPFTINEYGMRVRLRGKQVGRI
jgi:hypothetical protein